MANVIITINTDNAAFADDEGFEVARILRGLADHIETSDELDAKKAVRDINGNTIGYLIIDRKGE